MFTWDTSEFKSTFADSDWYAWRAMLQTSITSDISSVICSVLYCACTDTGQNITKQAKGFYNIHAQ